LLSWRHSTARRFPGWTAGMEVGPRWQEPRAVRFLCCRK